MQLVTKRATRAEATHVNVVLIIAGCGVIFMLLCLRLCRSEYTRSARRTVSIEASSGPARLIVLRGGKQQHPPRVVRRAKHG